MEWSSPRPIDDKGHMGLPLHCYHPSGRPVPPVTAGEPERSGGGEFSDSFWWQNGFLNTFTTSFFFLWKTTVLSENEVCLFSLIQTP